MIKEMLQHEGSLELLQALDKEREKLAREIKTTVEFQTMGSNLKPDDQLSVNTMALIDNMCTNFITFSRPRELQLDVNRLAISIANIFAERLVEMGEVSQLTPDLLDS